ncbi:MAG: hypothetical protein JWM46_309, partial [Candidatus Kaiserbacteria bacterium]|nr:hypothetical protein [Candidatus Kaiserbacteria bacterium]
MSLRRTASFLILGTVFLTCVSVGTFASAQTCNIPGTRPATAADSAVQNGTITAGTCYNPNEVGIGQSTETAKVFLNSVPKKCVGACAAPPDKAHIEHLNDTFATCAANFIKAYNQKYGVIYISSAYRDGPSGENARAGGAPGSNHTKGLAIDMSPANGDFQTMWKFASQNPQFGVCFPYLGSDRPHMTLAGTGTGEAAKCAAQGVTKQCSGAPNFTPSAVTAGGPSMYDEGGPAYGNTGVAPATSPYTMSPAFPGAPAPTFAPTAPLTTPIATTPAQTTPATTNPATTALG